MLELGVDPHVASATAATMWGLLREARTTENRGAHGSCVSGCSFSKWFFHVSSMGGKMGRVFDGPLDYSHGDICEWR